MVSGLLFSVIFHNQIQSSLFWSSGLIFTEKVFGAKIFEGERMWGRGMGREVDMPFYAMQHLQAEIVETSLVFCFRRQEVLLFSFYLIYYQLY